MSTDTTLSENIAFAVLSRHSFIIISNNPVQ
jgi:hypothetical protein